MFTVRSEFQLALAQLEGVMRDTVYLSPRAVLQLARVTERSGAALDSQGKKLTSIRKMTSILIHGD